MKILSIANNSFVAGVNDNDVLGATPDLSRYDIVMFESDQPVDCQGSLDGVNYASTALALQDCHVAASAGTYVLTSAANKIYRVVPEAKFTKIRFLQNGASAVTALRVLLGRRSGD